MELEALLERALGHADEGDWTSAAELLREHVDEHSEEAAVYCWLAVAERELGHDGISYELFKKALSLEPQDPYVLATAGNGVATFDDPDAMEALKTAALIAPDVPVARLLYGAYLAREGFHELALEQLGAARDLDSEDPQIAYELGVAHALAGALDRACDVLGEAVSLAPDDGWNRAVFGLVLLENGQMEEAAGELSEAARLRPEDVEAQVLAAAAAAATGRVGLAYEMIERARLRAIDGDLALLSSLEDRIDEGPEASARLLTDTLAPDALRSRLQERP